MTQVSDGHKRRGLAALPLERRREIARKGGKRAHELGRAHTWDFKEAQEAGRKGGRVSRRKKRQIDYEPL